MLFANVTNNNIYILSLIEKDNLNIKYLSLYQLKHNHDKL